MYFNMYNTDYSYDLRCWMQFFWSKSSSVWLTGCVFIPSTIQEVNICTCNACELCSTLLTSWAVLMNNHTEKQLCFHVCWIQNACQLVSVHTWLGWVHYHRRDKVAVLGRFKFLPIFALMRVIHSKRRQSIITWIWQTFSVIPYIYAYVSELCV